jgi:uncharacterized protein (TIGR04255 family)
MAKTPFKLDLNETFRHLSNPPIVEAVIHWQARAQKLPESETLRSILASRLPEYISCEPIQQVALMAMVSAQDSAPVVQHQKDWHGFRVTSGDNRHIIQFKRDGVVFSRTHPYEDWDQFAAAARNAWRAFVEIAAPVEIQRLGVRFINHITGATPETLDQFLREPPTCPSNLPLKEFVYQSTFAVPEQPYGIRVIKVMQPSMDGLPESSGLFIDCDVYTTRSIACDDPAVDDSLVKDGRLPISWSTRNGSPINVH